MRKKFTFLGCLLFIGASVFSQVTEDVNFDYYLNSTDNDLVNHFSGGYGLSQVQNNGITGGCLQTPDSINWGNDNAVYCSTYQPIIGDTTVTAICLKYDSAGVHPASFQRAMSIWIIPYSDFNHYIVATVSGNKKLELLTYGWNNNPYPTIPLLNGHWYRYQLKVAFIGGASNSVYIRADVFDLGTSGTSIPFLLTTSSGTINDNVLMADTSIQVSMNGTKYGGALYLDDFHFYGREGSTSCINVPTGILNNSAKEHFRIYTSRSMHSLVVERSGLGRQNSDISICNLVGEKLKVIHSLTEKTEIDISSLAGGIYLVECRSEENFYVAKIFVER